MDCCKRLNCSLPRRIAARISSALKRGRVVKKKEEYDDVPPPTHVASSSDVLSSERRMEEANVNVIIDCFLLQLIAESKNELSKMTASRIQLESVLENVKDELRNKELFIATAAKERLESNDDRPLKFDDVPNDEDDCLDQGMDRLEAELEAELEFLQLHLDSAKSSTNQPQETIEERTVDNSSRRSDYTSNGEVIDPTIYGEEQESQGLQSGVPPYELERRLHELLEMRQEQQIRELKVALASAKQELREKEREISWWKDTSQLMSRHVQEPLRFDFRHRANMPHRLR